LDDGDGIPPTYLSLQEAAEAPRAPAGTIYFLKHALLESGTSVRCFFSLEDLGLYTANEDMADGSYVIQREVEDMLLYEGRKFNVRSFVVIWQNTCYLWHDYMFKVHTAQYSQKTLSYDVHMDPATDIRPLVFRGSDMPKDWRYGDAMVTEMARLIRLKIGPFAADLVGESAGSDVRYAIVGLDFLFSTRVSSPDAAADGGHEEGVQGWLLECNLTPCLYGTGLFSNAIKQKLAEDTIEVFLGPAEEQTQAEGADKLQGLPADGQGKFIACA
jgi:hypothetical protein